MGDRPMGDRPMGDRPAGRPCALAGHDHAGDNRAGDGPDEGRQFARHCGDGNDIQLAGAAQRPDSARSAGFVPSRQSSRTASGAAATLASLSLPTRGGCRYSSRTHWISMRRARRLPVLVIAPRRTRSPVECSEGTRPSQAISSRGVRNRDRSPISANSVVAALMALRGDEVDPAQRHQRRHQRRQRPVRHRRADRLLQPLHTIRGLAHRQQHLFQSQPLLGVLQLLPGEPLHHTPCLPRSCVPGSAGRAAAAATIPAGPSLADPAAPPRVTPASARASPRGAGRAPTPPSNRRRATASPAITHPAGWSSPDRPACRGINDGAATMHSWPRLGEY